VPVNLFGLRPLGGRLKLKTRFFRLITVRSERAQASTPIDLQDTKKDKAHRSTDIKRVEKKNSNAGGKNRIRDNAGVGGATVHGNLPSIQRK